MTGMLAAPQSITFDLPDNTQAEIDVRINRRAKHLRLKVEPDGQVVLVLPSPGNWPEGQDFLRERAIWLASRLRLMADYTAFAPDAVIPVLGFDHVIRHDPLHRGAVKGDDNVITISGKLEHLPRRLTDWLKAQAREELSERARAYAARLDRRIVRITLRDTKGRWGSCSANGNLSFCWRLILAPEHVLDYVAAHEVAHLVELSHSKKFWRIVEELRVDYKISDQWLTRHGSNLHRYG